MPSALTGVSWTCAGTAGSSCGTASGSGNINTTVSRPAGGRATYTVSATVSLRATDSLANTATVAAPTGGNLTYTANDGPAISPTDCTKHIAPASLRAI